MAPPPSLTPAESDACAALHVAPAFSHLALSVHPEPGVALWINAVRSLSTIGRRNATFDLTAVVWRPGMAPKAWRRVVPLDGLRSDPTCLFIEAEGWFVLNQRRCTGTLIAPDGVALRWDLSWVSQSEGVRPFGPETRGGFWAGTPQVSAQTQGSWSVDGDVQTLVDAPASLSHIHGECWPERVGRAWVAGGSRQDLAAVDAWVLGKTKPRLAAHGRMIGERIDWRPGLLGRGLSGVPSGASWALKGLRRDRALRIRLDADPAQTVVVDYRDPEGRPIPRTVCAVANGTAEISAGSGRNAPVLIRIECPGGGLLDTSARGRIAASGPGLIIRMPS